MWDKYAEQKTGYKMFLAAVIYDAPVMCLYPGFIFNPLPCFPSLLQWGGDSEHSEQGWGSNHVAQMRLKKGDTQNYQKGSSAPSRRKNHE
jgi:hypothetical protein